MGELRIFKFLYQQIFLFSIILQGDTDTEDRESEIMKISKAGSSKDIGKLVKQKSVGKLGDVPAVPKKRGRPSKVSSVIYDD